MKKLMAAAAVCTMALVLMGLLRPKPEPQTPRELVLFITQEPDRAEASSSGQEPALQTEREPSALRVLTPEGVRSMELEDYLLQVVLAEMPVTFSEEALKAQAVAARTFAARKMSAPRHPEADICTDSACCQAFASDEALQNLQETEPAQYEKLRRAVQETAGEVLTYDGALIDATYFSCSGGSTEAAVAVWGSETPYLQPVPSPGEEDAPRFHSQVSFKPEDLRRILSEAAPEACRDGEPESWLGPVQLTEGGGVDTMELGGVLFSGTKLRSLFGLNSARFTLQYADGVFRFDVLGFGHRVGMSQYGAEHLAQLGFSYKTILLYYYRGVQIRKLPDECPGVFDTVTIRTDSEPASEP